ncbi:MAG: hypothetical protein QM756_11435 [Polyangiaceae bacterium]
MVTALRGQTCVIRLISLGALLSACHDRQSPAPSPTPSASASAAPASTLVVDHGELDTKAPKDSARIAATNIATTVYKLADTGSRRLGYIRLGGSVQRDLEPVPGKGCKGQFYRVYPMGFVCTDEATIDLEAPLVRAASRRPESR